MNDGRNNSTLLNPNWCVVGLDVRRAGDCLIITTQVENVAQLLVDLKYKYPKLFLSGWSHGNITT